MQIINDVSRPLEGGAEDNREKPESLQQIETRSRHKILSRYNGIHEGGVIPVLD
jgi:hypothetical protein